MKRFSGRSAGACTLLLALWLLVLAGFSGCGGGSDQTGTGGKISLTDDAGHKLVLDGPVDRVVSIAPWNTEIVYALGAENKLVGVTTYCDYPPAAKKKEKIGDFATPNVEKIASLKPEVVLATGGIQTNVVDSLEKVGIKIFVVEPKNFNQLYSDLKKVGKILGVEGNAERVAANLEKRVNEVRNKTRDLPKPTVFFEIYSQPLMTAGKDTVINQMITYAGGKNLGATAGKEYPEYSTEKLLEANPDIYFATSGSMTNPADLASRPGYSALKAVKDGKIYVVQENLFVRSGPRIVDGLEQLAKKIHPEAFKNLQ